MPPTTLCCGGTTIYRRATECCRNGDVARMKKLYMAAGISRQECGRRRRERVPVIYGTFSALATTSGARFAPHFWGGYRGAAAGSGYVYTDTALGLAVEAGAGGLIGFILSNPLNDQASEGICDRLVCPLDNDAVTKWIDMN